MLKKVCSNAIDVKKLTDSDDFFMFEGYSSTFGNIDRGNDRVIKGAFKSSIKDLKSRATDIPNSDFKSLMPILWQHKHSEPIGSFVEMKEDDVGLFVKGIMPKSDVFVRDRVMPQMSVGSISDMSIGYRIEERSIDGEDVFNLEKLTLFETSLVTIPMNIEANITDFKSCEFAKNKIAEKSTIFDAESGDIFLCNKPIGFGNEIIPKGVFSLVAEIQMNRVKATEEEKSKINGIYKEMGLESPFSKSYMLGENEADTLTHRQLEKFLFASGAFSKEGAKLIVSKFKTIVRDADSDESVRDAAQIKTLNEILHIFKGE